MPGRDERRSSGRVAGGVRRLLRLEAAAALAGALWLYGQGEMSWWIFAAGFLLPDLSLLAYLRGPAAGAVAYNAAHSYLGPVGLGLIGLMLGGTDLQGAALIWVAHIGFDRLLGYGLKHPDSFASTHLGRIGRQRSSAPDADAEPAMRLTPSRG